MKKVGEVADGVLASPAHRDKIAFTRWQAGEMLLEALGTRDAEHEAAKSDLRVAVSTFLTDIYWDETGDGSAVAMFNTDQINDLRAALAGTTTDAAKPGPETELEKQLRAHLTIVEYFARKCVEGLATPLEALEAIRATAKPFIKPITDDSVLVLQNGGQVEGCGPAWVQSEAKPPPSSDEKKVESIKRAVVAHFGLKPRMLEGPGRYKSISHPRMVAMYLARKLTKLSFPQIGEKFGRRDHTTVMSAVEKIERLVREQASVRDCVESLTSRLSSQEKPANPCGHSDAEHASGLGGQSCTVLALPTKKE